LFLDQVHCLGKVTMGPEQNPVCKPVLSSNGSANLIAQGRSMKTPRALCVIGFLPPSLGPAWRLDCPESCAQGIGERTREIKAGKSCRTKSMRFTARQPAIHAPGRISGKRGFSPPW